MIFPFLYAMYCGRFYSLKSEASGYNYSIPGIEILDITRIILQFGQGIYTLPFVF